MNNKADLISGDDIVEFKSPLGKAAMALHDAMSDAGDSMSNAVSKKSLGKVAVVTSTAAASALAVGVTQPACGLQTAGALATGGGGTGGTGGSSGKGGSAGEGGIGGVDVGGTGGVNVGGTSGTAGSGGVNVGGTGGTGGAAECMDADDCPAVDNECQTRTCDNQVCGVDNVAAGTAIIQQVAGDCQEVVCDGNGSTMSQNDNNDVPNDNKECTNDVCTSGTPSNPNSVEGQACSENGGLVCDGYGTCHCNPSAANSITVLNQGINVGKHIEQLQVENGGATLNPDGTTKDSAAFQSLPSCMENVQAGSQPVFIIEGVSSDYSIELTHTSQFQQVGPTQIGFTYNCYDPSDFGGSVNPTQAQWQTKIGDGPTGNLTNNNSNPIILAPVCAPKKWAYVRAYVQP